MFNKLKKLSLIVFIVFLSSIPLIALAQSKEITFTPQIEFPNFKFQSSVVSVDAEGNTTSDLLPRYIKAIYDYSFAIGGILAAIVLMAGGLIWLTSAGDSGKVTKAKEIILGSITGLVILFSAFIILKTVNPDLVKMGGLKMAHIKNVSYCCHKDKGNVLANRDGSCPEGSAKCSDDTQCVSESNGVFKCAKNSGNLCCEYTRDYGNVKYCTTKSMDGGSCAETLKDEYNNNYNFSKSYPNIYCGNTVMMGSSCLAGNCDGRADGSHCAGFLNTQYGFCYNELCYQFAGKEYEPCGDRRGAICLKGTPLVPCPNTHGHNYVRISMDNIFVLENPIMTRGRDCGKGLYCCAPN